VVWCVLACSDECTVVTEKVQQLRPDSFRAQYACHVYNTSMDLRPWPRGSVNASVLLASAVRDGQGQVVWCVCVCSVSALSCVQHKHGPATVASRLRERQCVVGKCGA